MKLQIIVIILLLSSSLAGVAPYKDEDPLLKFIEIAEAHPSQLDHWEVIRKETKQVKDTEKFVNNFRMYERIAVTKGEDSINYIFVDTQGDAQGINVQYRIVIPKSSTGKIEFTAVLKGDRWNKKVEETYHKMMEKMDKTFFSIYEQRFTCIELIGDDTIKNRMAIEPIISVLELTNIDVQYDNVQNSTINMIYYGYTSLWDSFISLEGTPLNLQIAITEHENEELSYKIGTPILLTEY